MLNTTALLPSPRLQGLDTLRAIAISIVLIYHYRVVVSREDIFGFWSQLGWTGVDLFFVLSGYLIGNQIFSALVKQQTFSLKQFYMRRFLRTLPNYYVVLGLYFLFPLALGGTATAPLWSFLTFTQNLNMHAGETFTHSWSLCIEEQFYLILPLLALVLAAQRRVISLSWSLLIGAMIFAACLRAYNYQTHGQAAISSRDFMEYIYYSSFTRFDELLPGVAIALLKNFHPTFFARLLARGNLLLVAGIAAVAGVFYLLQHYFYIEGYGYSFAMVSLAYSAIAISFSLLVLAALSPQSLLYRLRVPGAASLALWSYAIYLIHKPLFLLLKQPLTDYGIDINAAAGVVIILGVSLVSGWALYQFVESPFMSLRERFYPSNIKSTVATTVRPEAA